MSADYQINDQEGLCCLSFQIVGIGYWFAKENGVIVSHRLQFGSGEVFLTSPIGGMTTAFNRYLYCGGNPLNRVDPSGYIDKPLRPDFDDIDKGGSGVIYIIPTGFDNGNHRNDNSYGPGDGSVFPVYGLYNSPQNDFDYDMQLGINIVNTGGGNAYLNSVINAAYHGQYNSVDIQNSKFVGVGGWNYYQKFAIINGEPVTIAVRVPIKITRSHTAQGQGGDVNNPAGLPEWTSTANTGVGAFTTANGAKTELIKYAGKSASLGKAGTQYLRYAKGLGYLGAGLSTTYSIANSVSYYNNGGTDWQVGAKSTLDVIMTGVGFLGPIGFGLSATYFILDASGVFDDFGNTKP